MSRIADKLLEAFIQAVAWTMPLRAPTPVPVYAYYRRNTGAVRPPAIRR